MANQNPIKIGDRFGKLVVTAIVAGTATKNRAYLCDCDCGGKSAPCASSLLKKKLSTKSCGCLRKSAVHRNRQTHGMTHTSTYTIWAGMKGRCTRPVYKGYARYGGRGITVCERWGTFENFLADMGERPEGMSLDRIDNNGNYEPSNCRWATSKQQSSNMRSNVLIEFRGEWLIQSEVARRLGINHVSLIRRIKNGRPIDAPRRAWKKRSLIPAPTAG